jgi:hypothetical protein
MGKNKLTVEIMKPPCREDSCRVESRLEGNQE